jgi:hypothetical protein
LNARAFEAKEEMTFALRRFELFAAMGTVNWGYSLTNMGVPEQRMQHTVDQWNQLSGKRV